MLNNIYQELLIRVNQNNKCIMLTYLDYHGKANGSIEHKIVMTRQELEEKFFPLKEAIYEKILIVLDTGLLQFIHVEEDKAVLMEPFMPKPRLIVFGGGHIAKPLSEFAARVGFSVTIVDDRPFFANSARFPDAEKVICESMERAVDVINLVETDYVVIVTRGHRHDGVVLRKVQNYELSYVGMIGSKRRVTAMMEELLKEGYSKEKLDLVNSPIGIDINAITPDEIAISIVAQLISYKNKVTMTKFGKDYSTPEFDKEVAEKASENQIIPKALFTIISSKGSVPRKAGAKMIAYLDGRTVGSIGGGCSEAGVIANARKVMNQEKSFFIEFVDMTGDVAESEGMVCGGVMEVLVEAL